jgi:DNA-directed RNA polymerase subunit H (RpoH/RPB5)
MPNAYSFDFDEIKEQVLDEIDSEKHQLPKIKALEAIVREIRRNHSIDIDIKREPVTFLGFFLGDTQYSLRVGRKTIIHSASNERDIYYASSIRPDVLQSAQLALGRYTSLTHTKMELCKE